MDRLSKMFELQDALQERLGTWKKIKEEGTKQQFINQMLLAVVEETVEIMRETPYKNPSAVPYGWKKGQIGDREKYLSECVDLFHFLMNLVLAEGFTAEDFYEAYCMKNNLNHVRQDNAY